MLWLSGEPLWPYWGGMGVKVWEMLCGLGTLGHTVCIFSHGLGGLVDLQAEGIRGLRAFGKGFGVLGIGG
jgi:hypothetical protein